MTKPKKETWAIMISLAIIIASMIIANKIEKAEKAKFVLKAVELTSKVCSNGAEYNYNKAFFTCK